MTSVEYLLCACTMLLLLLLLSRFSRVRLCATPETAARQKSGKKYVKAVYGIKIAGRNINNLRYADDTTFMA